VLELTELRGCELQARQLAIDPVEHPDHESEHHTDAQPPAQEQRGDDTRDDQGDQSDLIRRDVGRRESSYQEVLEGGVEVLPGRSRERFCT